METTETITAGAGADQLAQEVFDTVARMVTEIIGEEYASALEITRESMVTEDLELESIEFVALAEKLRDHYGERVDFVDWIASMELDQIILLTVGQLVDFIVSCLT